MSAREAVYWFIYRTAGALAATKFLMWRTCSDRGLGVPEIASRLHRRHQTIWRWLSTDEDIDFPALSDFAFACDCRVNVELVDAA